MSGALDEVRFAMEAQEKLRLGQYRWKHATDQLRTLLGLPDGTLVHADDRPWRVRELGIYVCDEEKWGYIDARLMERYPDHGVAVTVGEMCIDFIHRYMATRLTVRPLAMEEK